MSDEPKSPVGIKIAPSSSELAPFVYFDGVATMGTNHGLIQIELAANVMMPDSPGGVRTDVLITAHLRCSPSAAADLRQAIDKALGMLQLPAGTPPEPANVN
jgi:hypothetical protein